MMDLLLVLLLAGFFAVCFGLDEALKKLKE
jgi:hypothetical protein